MVEVLVFKYLKGKNLFVLIGRTVVIRQCNAITGIGLWEAIDELTSKLLLARNQTEILDADEQQDEIGELEVETETQTSELYCS